MTANESKQADCSWCDGKGRMQVSAGVGTQTVDCPHCEDAREANESKQAGVVLDTIFKFLLGESPLDGLWFGERRPDRGQWWWRTNLREAFNEYATAIAARDLWMERAGAALLMIPDDKLCGDLRAAKERLTEQRQTLEAQLAAAIAERENLQAEKRAAELLAQGLKTLLRETEKERDTAREALRNYGWHKRKCEALDAEGVMRYTEEKCTCGFDAALAHPSPASASTAPARGDRAFSTDGGKTWKDADGAASAATKRQTCPKHPNSYEPCPCCADMREHGPASPPSNDGEGSPQQEKASV